MSSGGAATEPSGLNCTRSTTLSSRAIGGAGRRVPAFAEALSQRVDLALRQLRGRAVGLAERGAVLSSRPVAACRSGSRLSSSAAILFGSNYGCGFGGCCGRLGLGFVFGLLLRLFLLQGFGDRIDLRRSFFSGLVSAFFAARHRAGGGGAASALAASSTFLSVTLALESSTGFGSPILSTSGCRRLVLGPVLDALGRSRRTACRETMSIGSASFGLASSGLRGKRDQAPQQQGCVKQRRDRQAGFHLRQLHGPCSTSVTSATLRKPAAESRPMTFITVP